MTGAWLFANFEETANGTGTYATSEAAQRAAVTDYEAGNSGPFIRDVAYEWRTSDNQPDHHLLFEDSVFTGYWVQPLDAAADEVLATWRT